MFILLFLPFLLADKSTALMKGGWKFEGENVITRNGSVINSNPNYGQSRNNLTSGNSFLNN